ncbi:MAG: FAD:protein FMN transferase [Gammaproteobacteria bacterium]
MNRLVLSKLIALLIGFGCVLLAYNYNKSATYFASGPIFGTSWKLVTTEYITDSLKQSIQNELNRIDLIASNYKTNSELSFINKSPTDQIINISDEMFTMLSFAEDLYIKTSGLYDITLGSLIIDEGFGPLASMNDKSIQVSSKRFKFISDTSIIKNDNFQFDLSSIAKGFAVDSVSKILLAAGKNNFLIDIGGEVIISGSKHNQPWIIGIQDPTSVNDSSTINIFGNDFLAVATSGEYRNFKYNDDGEMTSHTFNPISKTSIPDKTYSVSVISSVSSMEADALATALNVMGPVKGIEFANEKDLSVMYIMQGEKLIKSNKWDYND